MRSIVRFRMLVSLSGKCTRANTHIVRPPLGDYLREAICTVEIREKLNWFCAE